LGVRGGVAAIVKANTDTDIEPKPPWKKRKEAYIKALPKKSVGAQRVSLADKLHNARAIVADHAVVGEKLWQRFNAPKADTAWYYD
jgi:(p)ppGpp synthase/HD superfamily hydrolase